jgi:hypothetical protein
MSLINLRKEAKRWLKDLRSGDAEARARLERAYPSAPARPVLRDVQHALAREHGHESWSALKQALDRRPADTAATPPLRAADEYDRAASDMVLAFNAKDDTALQRLNAFYQRAFTFDDLWAEVWRRLYSFRQRAFKAPTNHLEFAEAQLVIAQDAGFAGWAALMRAVETGAPPIPPHDVDTAENRIAPRRLLSDGEWDELIAIMEERRITRLDAGGMMTDAVLARIAELDHVTEISLGGSRQLTDDGLLHLARMPQLEKLDLSEYPGGRITDRGLDVLRYLPNLRIFEMTWQRGITDAGVANLRFCDRIERVNLMGSPTGDGAIEALQGKSALQYFSSGRLVTDAGLPHLHNFPRLKAWHGPPVPPDGDGEVKGGAHLLIDGPFTDAGLAGLAGLEGVFELDMFWHVTGITSQGFAHLVGLPNLASLGADGALSDDVAMGHFAAMPRLRRLRAQGAVATDEGFAALSQSKTIQFIWGRECPNFRSRGFVALSRMPALRGFGISCKQVDDQALSTLPAFPSLRELTPIDVKDDGFRHVGRCARLERLTCMYCRDTTDAATSQITELPLKYYYAGLTHITDRSLELLARIASLEQIDLYEVQGVTDAGLPFLAQLPKLREVNLDGLPGVSLAGTRVFPPHVRVRYTT